MHEGRDPERPLNVCEHRLSRLPNDVYTSGRLN